MINIVTISAFFRNFNIINHSLRYPPGGDVSNFWGNHSFSLLEVTLVKIITILRGHESIVAEIGDLIFTGFFEIFKVIEVQVCVVGGLSNRVWYHHQLRVVVQGIIIERMLINYCWGVLILDESAHLRELSLLDIVSNEVQWFELFVIQNWLAKVGADVLTDINQTFKAFVAHQFLVIWFW